MNSVHTTLGRSERGAITVLLALGIAVMIAAGAFAIDLGSALVTEAELQNAADAGALAGSRELALIYREFGNSVDYEKHVLTSAERARIQAKITTYAGRNYTGNKAVAIRPEDIDYGAWDPATNSVRASNTGVKVVALKSRRDTLANGPVDTVFGRMLGVKFLAVRSESATGVTSLGGLAAGGGGIPVGLSETWFANHSCENTPEITLYPTGTSCAGWHTFMEAPASASKLTTILRELRAGTYTSPRTMAGETIYNFTGGTLGSVFDDMKALFDAKKDAGGGWEVVLPVYRSETCGNPSGPILIVGFARARITTITSTPEKSIRGVVRCGVLDAADGAIGGGAVSYGTLYGSPSVVH